MAIILYTNGLTEEYKPKNLVFTEDEILKLFDDDAELGTLRAVDILNTWCVYQKNKIDEEDYNKIASHIMDVDLYHHVVFIHDSEINSEWKVTDDIIYKTYKDFLVDLKEKIEAVADNIIRKYTEEAEADGSINSLPFLIAMGITKDKRILFEYNPERQSKEFYENEQYDVFSEKIFEYLSKNKPKKSPFIIFSDNKAVIIVEKEYVNDFLDKLIDKFKSKEKYEVCDQIIKIKEDWMKKQIRKKTTKSRKTRESKNNSENTDGK